MSHYEVLGISESASPADVRAAYLRLARSHHPDRLGDATPAQRRAAELRMGEINAAWAVLSDAGRRAVYDNQRRGAPAATTGANVNRPSEEFRPYYSGTEEDDPALLDDSVTGRTVLSRRMTFLPATLFIGGVVLLILGAFIGIAPMFAAGGAAIVLSLLSFLFVPLLALANSSRGDPDSR